MDLKLKTQTFLVTGASSGFGRKVAEILAEEGAGVIAVARSEEKLKELQNDYGKLITYYTGDLFREEFVEELLEKVKDTELHGVFVNAGGPPAMGFLETGMSDWDEAFRSVVRWKLQLVKGLLPGFRKRGYGRIVFLESAAIRQPVANLVLSNAMRMSIAGAAKTLSLEVASEGITVNIMAPGFHKTSAVDRIIKKRAQTKQISFEEAEEQITSKIPVGFAGDPQTLAMQAVWLLSPHAAYITGQMHVIDGGSTRFSLG